MDAVGKLQSTIKNQQLKHLIGVVIKHWQLLSRFNSRLADCTCKSTDNYKWLEAKYEAVVELADTIPWPLIIGKLDDDPRLQLLYELSGRFKLAENLTKLQRRLVKEIQKVIRSQDRLRIEYKEFIKIINCKCSANVNLLKSNFNCYSDLIAELEMIAINHQENQLEPAAENVNRVEVVTIDSDDDIDDINVDKTVKKNRMRLTRNKPKSLVWSCDQSDCRFKTVDRQQLYQHKLEQHQITELADDICPDCGKRYKSQLLLKIHRRLHNGTLLYQCQHPGCGKRFSFQAFLNQHKPRHTSEKRFKCRVSGCDRRFKYPWNEKQHHVDMHQMLNVFWCQHPGCGYMSKRKGTLRTHQRKIHNYALACDFAKCGYVFGNDKDLIEHRQREHAENATKIKEKPATSAPKEKRPKLPTDEKNNDKEDEVCLMREQCRRPDADEVNWVQCDGPCQGWFHQLCIGIDKPEDIAEEDQFFCNACC